MKQESKTNWLAIGGLVLLVIFLALGYRISKFSLNLGIVSVDMEKPTEKPFESPTPNMLTSQVELATQTGPIYFSTETPLPSPAEYFGEWIIVIGKFPSLDSAKSYIVPFTNKGFSVQIFCRISEADPTQTPEIRAAVIGFQSEDLMIATLPQVQALNSSAYSRQFSVWCKNPGKQGDYVSCNFVSCP